MNRKQLTMTVAALILLLVISDMLYLYASKRHRVNQAVKVYNEFVEGKRSYGGEYIVDYATPTREPKRRNATDYFIIDSTGDGIPELHLLTPREHMVFTCRDNEMVWLNSFYSQLQSYRLLENGVMVH